VGSETDLCVEVLRAVDVGDDHERPTALVGRMKVRNSATA
jgi:hypothetical protein